MKRLVLLMYHMIREPETAKEARYACPPWRFRQHLLTLRRLGYALLSLADLERAFYQSAELPEPGVAITLDDGHQDNYSHAFPILQELEVPATIFLATSYLGQTNAWMAASGFPERPMLTWEQVQEMHRYGIAFGGHTLTHPRLTQLDERRAYREILGCKQAIEDRLGSPCQHFAYPYGLLDARVRDLVELAGYRLACSTRPGFNHLGRDPLVLHRIEVLGSDSPRMLAQKIRFGTNQAGYSFLMRYYLRRAKARLWSK